MPMTLAVGTAVSVRDGHRVVLFSIYYFAFGGTDTSEILPHPPATAPAFTGRRPFAPLVALEEKRQKRPLSRVYEHSSLSVGSLTGASSNQKPLPMTGCVWRGVRCNASHTSASR
ncbi:MAG: hypothetical protein KC441_05850 [Anaerolineales bacterium]|nr:hypothetical protein [Anaerolineales bacterium]